MADAQPFDLSSLLNLLRSVQSASNSAAPEPPADLPNGQYSQQQAQRWLVWRNAKIQASQVPQSIKDKMIASEDYGEGEPAPHTDQSLFSTRDNPLIQPGPGGAPVGARDVPGSADRNRFWNADPNGEGPNIAPYNAPGVQDDRVQPVSAQQLMKRVDSAEGGGSPNDYSKVVGQAQQDVSAQFQRLIQQLYPSSKPDERQNPEDMFTPEENLARNQGYAKPGPYLTALSPEQEAQFQAWVKANNVNWKPSEQDYDMRGFWLAQQQGDPAAKASIDPNDKSLHYPDMFKTPYDATFSNESQYALPVAPQWKGDQYVLPNGHVQYDDVVGRWYEPPGTDRTKKGDTE